MIITDVVEEIIRIRELYYASIAMFVMVLVLIPIKPVYATLLLFSIVCLWSRIPCMLSALTKDLEVIDFFTVMVALKLGGMTGGLFGAANMLFSRLFGPLEWPMYTVKDSISIFVGGLLMPLAYRLFGGNLFFTIYAFTAIRYLLYIVLTYFLEYEALGLEIGICVVSVFVAYASNTIMVSVFGEFTLELMKTGVGFNLSLFGFVAAILGLVVFTHYLYAKWKKEHPAGAPLPRPKGF